MTYIQEQAYKQTGHAMELLDTMSQLVEVGAQTLVTVTKVVREKASELASVLSKGMCETSRWWMGIAVSEAMERQK